MKDLNKIEISRVKPSDNQIYARSEQINSFSDKIFSLFVKLVLTVDCQQKRVPFSTFFQINLIVQTILKIVFDKNKIKFRVDIV